MKLRLYRFIYSKQAEKFLRKTSLVTREAIETGLAKGIRKIAKEEINNADVIPMKGAFRGNFRLRIGEVRVVFAYLEGEVRIVTIDSTDVRGNMYRIN